MYDVGVRTTLTIDDDVLAAARDLAEVERRTVGQVLSDLARQALGSQATDEGEVRNGIPLLPRTKGGTPVTMELVNRLRDDEW